jgi:L-seryl-tRNA(Ser) seleniumtransferase
MDMPRGNSDPYRALGVRSFINCCSVRTIHGGSLMLPSARAAMAAASQRFVNLDELMEAAGARIAELTGAEWGMVTCGSAAALVMATAACVAGNDPAIMLRLPFTDGIPNKVAIMKEQRFAYDQAIRMVGTHMIECETEADLAGALDSGDVAMICVLGKGENRSQVRIERMAELARSRGVPILVDAASEMIENPSPWLHRGADLVVYSGGKFLRGPQTSGLLLGNKRLVQAAWRNAAPHHAFGRPMKVSKEDVVGLVAALEHWFTERDATAEQRRWSSDLSMISELLAGIPGVSTEIEPPGWMERVPNLLIRWDQERYGLDTAGLHEQLRAGEPRIMLDEMVTEPNTISIDPFNLQPGEAKAVGLALTQAFRAVGRPASEPKPIAGSVSGEWEFTIHFLKGSRQHRAKLVQSGSGISGQQVSDGISGLVTGALSATGIKLTFETKYEGSTIFYTLEGSPNGATMSGTAHFGAANGTNHGILNLKQHGAGTWKAHRAA